MKKSNVLVCYVETDTQYHKDKKILYSCERLGIKPKVFGRGKQWNGAIDKFLYFLDGIENMTVKEKYILFVDSRDVLFVKDLKEIEKRYKRYFKNYGLVFNGETNCYPNKDLAVAYPHQDKKYKYLNAGMCMGRTDFIMETFPKLKEHFTDYEKNWSEQGVWTNIFFDYLKKYESDSPITLDYDCKIFQCLWDEEWGRSANFDIVYNKHKIYNKLTKTEPCVFHTPGPTCSDSQVWKIINNKYHITNRSEDFYEYI
tara:strand:+ start:254 stop:1021 length:768 start_codon:yes stop_codon:yes gene_type:complete